MHVYARATSAQKFRVGLVTTVATVALLIGLTPALGKTTSLSGGGYVFSASERCIMRKINSVRHRYGRHGLAWDRQLGYVARSHANTMAAKRAVYHDYAMGQKVTHWRRLGQNTGRGGRCPRIFQDFMNSSPHRANILGRWRYIGVGTEWRGHRLYVQQIFESRHNPGNIYGTR
jgi:uncharacterized protein YkwD